MQGLANPAVKRRQEHMPRADVMVEGPSRILVSGGKNLLRWAGLIAKRSPARSKTADPSLETIASPIIFPWVEAPSLIRPKTGRIELPSWAGELDFRFARLREISRLKYIYESSWNSIYNEHDEEAAIRISRLQLLAQIINVPQGQIVGCLKESGKPISMINVMRAYYESPDGFNGYHKDTGRRTFITSADPEELSARLEQNRGKALGLAYCVSIAVDPEYQGSKHAHETLNYAILLSRVMGLIPAPYSAPRGYRWAKEENDGLDLITYLHMTKKNKMPFEDYREKMSERLARVAPALLWKDQHGLLRKPRFVDDVVGSDLYKEYNIDVPTDPFTASFEETAFARFRREYGELFRQTCGRDIMIEDFCALSGRTPRDFVMAMHIRNGARFPRDGKGDIAGIIRDSRPEDTAALGYNIILSYVYHQLLGHQFMDRSRLFL
jgi:hypothetical protein